MSVQVDMDSLVSVSEVSSRGVSKLVTEAEGGREWVILRGSKPAAAMIGIERFRHLQELERLEHTVELLVTALGRLVTERDLDRHRLDEVLDELGLTDADLVTPSLEIEG